MRRLLRFHQNTATAHGVCLLRLAGNSRRDHIGMSGLNQFAAYLFSSGDVFFVGAVLIAFGRAITWHFRRHRAAMWFRMLTILGVIFMALSMTPLPWWLFGLCLMPPLISLNVPFQADDKTRWPLIIRRAQPLVEFILLACVTAELIERHRLHVRPLATMPAEVHIIGDSLSAGIASEQVHLWPNLVASDLHIPVRNHAQAGATTTSAFRQAEEIASDDGLVLIEIGGNDLLSGRDSRQIEADLNRLLVRLKAPSRTLVMFEIPVPPIPGGYNFARLQRRLAHRYSVRMIPRREFAQVLLTPGATTDGLHLSFTGHRALADLLLRTLLRPTRASSVAVERLSAMSGLSHSQVNRMRQASQGTPASENPTALTQAGKLTGAAE